MKPKLSSQDYVPWELIDESYNNHKREDVGLGRFPPAYRWELEPIDEHVSSRANRAVDSK